MNDYERYLFDLNGYIVLNGVLTQEEITLCNAAIDHEFDRAKERSPSESLAGESEALKGIRRREDLADMLAWSKPWCQPFRDLLVHPKIVPYLEELLGGGFRLDHLYGIVMRRGAEGHTLHGGGTADDLTSFYQFHNGKMRCGLTVVTWVLTDSNAGDGGFACIPGSHKSNYRTPRDIVLMESDEGIVKQVEARAGSAIIFTEALTHGTMPWLAEHQRRCMLYKYSPGPLSWSPDHMSDLDQEVLDELTQEQRSVLEPPYIPDRPTILHE